MKYVLNRKWFSLGDDFAILDEKGSILAVNRAWREFAVANSAKTEMT